MTTKTHKHIRPRRVTPARNSFMESLGFSETPTVSYVSQSPPRKPAPSRLVSTATHRVTTVEEMWDTTELHADSMVDWMPAVVDSGKLNKRVHWKTVFAVLLLIFAVSAGAYWFYRAPLAAADLATEQVSQSSGALASALTPLAEVTATLTPVVDEVALDLAAATSDVDQAGRSLFEIAAGVPDSLAKTRTDATAAASGALSIVKQLNTVSAYLGAVAPILTGPVLETDADLVDLADAAERFAGWQSHFDSVREVLPDTVMTPINEQLAELSSDLGAIQSAYLDALREKDRVAAVEAVRDLEGRLANVWQSLVAETESVKTSALADIESTRRTLDLLTG